MGKNRVRPHDVYCIRSLPLKHPLSDIYCLFFPVVGTEAFLPLKSTLAACPSMRSFCIWASTVPLLIDLLPVLAHPHVEEVTFVLVGTLPRLEHTVRRMVDWKQLEATLMNGFPQLARFRFVQQHSEWAEKWMPLDELVRGWVRDELGADVAGMLYFD